MRNLTLLTFCVALFLLRASYGHQRLVVFGDSLSDDGNTFAVAGVPGMPYFDGRYSNGPNWVDYFPGIANHFNVDIALPTPWLKDPTSSDDNATDFAVGGSTSGDSNVLNGAFPKFPDQIMAYPEHLGSNSPADDLCVIWIGANDFAAGIKPPETVANIKGAIENLSTFGAKNFVVVTIPDLALTPQVKALGGATILAATQFVVAANVLLAVELPRFAFAHQISIDLIDINAIFIPLVLSPGRFGFTNSSGEAYNLMLPPSSSNPVPDPNDYVFWDGFHPTTNVHKIAAALIFDKIFLSRHIRPFLSFR
jgi:phospholipase/lecithinase/hemolysin